MYTITAATAANVSVTGILEIGEVLVVGAPVKRVRKVAVSTAAAVKADREARRNLWSATEAAELLGLSYGGFKAAADRAASRFSVAGHKIGKRTYWSDADLELVRASALTQGQHEF